MMGMEILITALHFAVYKILPFVILLGILVFIHELGHFLVARWCGVRVEVFSLGFGKKLLQYKRGDTVYALSLVPLGGYVKMFGEQPGTEISEEDKKVAFTHKNVWQRIAIVAAGPLMNFFFAIFIFMMVAITGEDAKRPIVGDVAPGSVAAQMGFQAGDTIVTVNNSPIVTWEDFQNSISRKNAGEINLAFEVLRESDGSSAKFESAVQTIDNPNILSKFSYVANLEGLSPFSRGTTIGIKADSPLAALGVKAGDKIVSVNQMPTVYWRHLDKLLASIPTSQALDIELERYDMATEKTERLAINLTAQSQLASYSTASLGIEGSEVYIGQVMPKSPAEAAGLKAGDRFLIVADKAVQKWEDIVSSIKSFDGKNPVAIQVQRGTEVVDLKITPTMTTQMTPQGTEDKRYTIGILAIPNLADPEIFTVKSAGPLAALEKGFERTWDMSVLTVMSFVRLFQAKISHKNIGGPISIGQAAAETFKLGWTQFFQMMAILSVNLFILNLLPIPVLDGGHLMFYTVEIIKGAPMSMKKMEIAQQIGLAVVMSLMILALFNDFTRILGL